MKKETATERNVVCLQGVQGAQQKVSFFWIYDTKHTTLRSVAERLE